MVRNPLGGQHVGKQHRVADDEQQHDGNLGGIHQHLFGVLVNQRKRQGFGGQQQVADDDLRQAVPFILPPGHPFERTHVAVDEDGDEEGIDGGHRRRLSRAADAAVNRTEDDDDQHQPPDSTAAGAGQRLEPDPGLRWQPFVPGNKVNDDHQQGAHQDARQEAGHEQASGRFFGGCGVHQHDDRWRNQDAEGPGVGDDAGRHRLGVTGLNHPGDDDRADRGNRRRGRTGHRGEDHAGEHRGHRQAAANPADAVDGKIDDPGGDPAGRQKGGRQDKEGDRQQGIVLRLRLKQFQGDGRQGVVGKE